MRFLFCLLLCGLNASANEDFCQLMLASGEVKNHDLNARVLGHLEDKLALAKATRQFSFIQEMHEVTEKLIAENTITRSQADALLAEQLLGRYETIFRTYIVAELRVREFTPDEIVQFLVHFDDAFSAREQVMFALDVTRRMLMTINEETSTSRSKHLKKFLATAQAFHLPPDTYASFLQLWAHIRAAEPSTIVHYILGNIKNSGSAIREATFVKPTEPPAPENKWVFVRFLEELVSGTGGQQSSSLAQTLLAIDSVPEDLLNVPGLGKPFGPTPSFAERYRAKDAAPYIEKFESFPPFAHNFIFAQELPGMSLDVLEKLPRTSFYQNLTDETRALVEPIQARFYELRQLERQLHAAVSRHRGGAPAVILAGVLRQFDKSLEACLEDANLSARGNRERQEVFACVEGAYLEVCRMHGGKIQVSDYMEIALATIKRIFPTTVERSVGATQALRKSSTDFYLSEEQKDQLLRSMNLYRWRDHVHDAEPATYYSGFNGLFNKAQWGTNVSQNRASVFVIDLPDVREVLGKIRDLLSAQGDEAKTLPQIYEMFAESK